jgi:hypothetical protein
MDAFLVSVTQLSFVPTNKHQLFDVQYSLVMAIFSTGNYSKPEIGRLFVDSSRDCILKNVTPPERWFRGCTDMRVSQFCSTFSNFLTMSISPFAQNKSSSQPVAL